MKISVIMPVYNAEKYLKEAILSILRQSFSNFEFIIIDDGSTDKSLEIIKRYKQEDKRIILISRENRGLIASLNEGLSLAQGEYIARMDADDISIQNRFELQYKFMVYNNIDVCGGDFISIDEFNNYLAIHTVPKTKNEILITMANNAPFAHPTVMIKKEFLDKTKLCYGVNGYKASEDVDLWINMHKNYAKFGNINDIVIKYRILETSYSRKNAKILKKEVNTQFNKFILENEILFTVAFADVINNYKILNYTQEKDLLRAILRFSQVTNSIGFISKGFRKVKIKSFIVACLSYFKMVF
jgi:glycosyltransferase involved in cell wall biosynthesis